MYYKCIWLSCKYIQTWIGCIGSHEYENMKPYPPIYMYSSNYSSIRFYNNMRSHGDPEMPARLSHDAQVIKTSTRVNSNVMLLFHLCFLFVFRQISFLRLPFAVCGC